MIFRMIEGKQIENNSKFAKLHTHRQGIVFHRFACDVHAVVKLQKRHTLTVTKNRCKSRITDLINAHNGKALFVNNFPRVLLCVPINNRHYLHLCKNIFLGNDSVAIGVGLVGHFVAIVRTDEILYKFAYFGTKK